MNSQNNFRETVLQVLQKHNHTVVTFMNTLKHNDIKTLDNITFKFTGVCRYYDLHAKPVGKDDKEYICIESWRD
jgi:hypothetical protein